MADSASVCPMLQTNQELAKCIPVYVDINTDADNPAGEDLTLPLGAQHSGTSGLVHFPPAQLDANEAALQDQLLAEWAYPLLGNGGHGARRPTSCAVPSK